MENSKRIWSPADKEFLLDSYGTAGMKYLTSRLKRSNHAIREQFVLLTGSCDLGAAGGLCTPVDLAEGVGVERWTILNWIHEYGLPAKKLNDNRQNAKHFRFFIEPTHFWRWAKKNKERINFSHVKRGVLLPEPEWLETEIKSATYQKRPTNWTTEEDEAAWFLWQSGVNYKEIAKRLNRPDKGTQRRLTTIRKRKGAEHAKTN